MGVVFFMRKFFSFFILLCVIVFMGCDVSADVQTGSLISIDSAYNLEEVAKLVKPAIVGISGDNNGSNSVGSGVCVAQNGYILTNSHVVNGCENITLYLSNGSTTTAKIVYEDAVLDLAILKGKLSLPYLQLGDSDDVEVGQDIFAVGTPLSLTLVHTYTKGIVSAINRTIKINTSAGEGYMQNLIQHDASLNPGNSGGPLLNLKGEVVGINTLKISSGEGIGFAIPTKSFRSLLNSFVSKINYQKPYLGVYGYDTEIANFNGESNINKGFYVIDVNENSPLRRIGLKNSSVITEINNRKISNALDLKNELYKLESGDVIELGYYHNGKYYKVKTQI